MTCTIQVTVDSRDPHAQADWWAQTLGWSVEPSDEDFIRTMIVAGHATESDTLVHNGTLVWREGAAICPAGQADGPGRQRILFQSVPEPKAGKNRVHWDVTLGDDDDADQARPRLEARGATYLATSNQGPHVWHVMADPEGNEFCIS
jgi:hypothetical protein